MEKNAATSIVPTWIPFSSHISDFRQAERASMWKVQHHGFIQ